MLSMPTVRGVCLLLVGTFFGYLVGVATNSHEYRSAPRTALPSVVEQVVEPVKATSKLIGNGSQTVLEQFTVTLKPLCVVIARRQDPWHSALRSFLGAREHAGL